MPVLAPVDRAYAAFARAGLTTPCTWRAQPGGSPVGPEPVDWRTPQAQVLPGEGAIADQPTAQWPTGVFAGAKEGDLLELQTPSGLVRARIDQLLSIGDGSETRATLADWPRTWPS